ncbi:MAG TPA: hypothetical protein VF125_12310 [Solirubrobacterales bacterium]
MPLPVLLAPGDRDAGVFAAGDVRHGSMSRVASAVGEGSIAIRLVHECLEEQARGDVRRSGTRPRPRSAPRRASCS